EIRPEALAASKQERQIRRESRPSRRERPRDTVGGPERRKVRIVRRWSGRSVGVHPPSVFWEPRFYMKRRPGTGLAFVAPARPATVRRSRAAVLALGLGGVDDDPPQPAAAGSNSATQARGMRRL